MELKMCMLKICILFISFTQTTLSQPTTMQSTSSSGYCENTNGNSVQVFVNNLQGVSNALESKMTQNTEEIKSHTEQQATSLKDKITAASRDVESKLTQKLQSDTQTVQNSIVSESKAIQTKVNETVQEQMSKESQVIQENMRQNAQRLQTEVSETKQDIQTNLNHTALGIETQMALNTQALQTDVSQTKQDIQTNINYTISAKSQEIQTNIVQSRQSIETKMAQNTQALQTDIQTNTQTLQSKVTEQSQIIQSKLNENKDAMQQKMDALLQELSELKNKTVKCSSSAPEHTPLPPDKVRRDCADIWTMDGNKTKNGIYTVHPDGKTPVQVYCDMSGGAYTVFQRRVDASQSFLHSWNTYKRGFGDLNKNFWLGNDNLALMTAQKLYMLRVDIFDISNTNKPYYFEYPQILILPEDRNFTLVLGSKSGGDNDKGFLRYHTGAPFSTFDRYNNRYSGSNNYAQINGAGWWYSSNNDYVDLNGPYRKNVQTSQPGGCIRWRAYTYSLSYSQMKFRPLGFTP